MQQGAVSHNFPELTKFVANCLDPLTENAHRTVTLGDGTKLRVEGRDAGVDVVLEEATKLAPDVASSNAVLDDEVEELCRDPCVEPLNNGQVILQPAGVGWGRSGVVGDVVQ